MKARIASAYRPNSRPVRDFPQCWQVRTSQDVGMKIEALQMIRLWTNLSTCCPQYCMSSICLSACAQSGVNRLLRFFPFGGSLRAWSPVSSPAGLTGRTRS